MRSALLVCDRAALLKHLPTQSRIGSSETPAHRFSAEAQGWCANQSAHQPRQRMFHRTAQQADGRHNAFRYHQRRA